MNLRELYRILSQKSSWITFKILESAVSYAISKVILWSTRRRNWRIQNERCLTALERYSHYKVQTHILNSPKLVGRQRATGNSRWSTRERRSSPEGSNLDTVGYSIQAQSMLADTAVVCTLCSAVGLLISAAEKTNEAPLLNFCQLACKLEVTSFFSHGAKSLIH